MSFTWVLAKMLSELEVTSPLDFFARLKRDEVVFRYLRECYRPETLFGQALAPFLDLFDDLLAGRPEHMLPEYRRTWVIVMLYHLIDLLHCKFFPDLLNFSVIVE